MQFSELTIKLIILFLPGLISVSLLQMFGNNKRLDNREFFILVVVNGFLSYIIPDLFFKDNSFFVSLLNPKVIISFLEVFIASVLSVGLAILEVYLSNHCVLYKIAQWAKITTNSGQDTVWDETFDNAGKGLSNFIYVRNHEANELYAGKVDNYTMSLTGKRELLLKDVDVYDLNNRRKKLYHLEGIYVSINDDKNIVIEIGESYND